jgi:starch-binding outer membrane protein, SusD/RagB family
MKHKLILTGFSAILLGLGSCTDLTSVEKDSIVTQSAATGTFTGDAKALLESAYNDLGLYTDQANIYSLQTHSSDEMIPPTRGTDWGDNGVWRTLDAHTWNPSHAYVTAAWNDLNTRIFKCNQILASTKPAPDAAQKAEAQFLRAFHMYQVMDCYGQVPIRGVNDAVDKLPEVLIRAKAYTQIETDLTDAIKGLTAIGPKAENSKASIAAAKALLARLYLNKGVYTAANPAGPYTFDNGDMAKVITLCNDIAASGYSLEDNYFTNFTKAASKEVIFTSAAGSPQNRWAMTLHYDSPFSGWNGFTTLADFYGKFEDGDQRKSEAAKKDGTEFSGISKGFLIGQQYSDKGNPITNSRNGKPLAFTANVNLSGAATDEGIRVIKYHPGDHGQYILLRYADVLLMKAEAQLRSGDKAGALATVNGLRAKRSAKALTDLTNDSMLDERGREMYWEGTRRMDLIRFGKFTTSNGAAKQDGYTVLFPIPITAILSNPKLSQNDGYR